MGKYVVKRIVLALLTAFIVLSLTYILLCCLRIERTLLPSTGAMLAYYKQQVARGFLVESTMDMSAIYGAELDSLKDAAGLTWHFYQAPVMDRYFRWIEGIVTRWDWGVSIGYELGRDCLDILISRLPTTVTLNISSVILSVPIGIGFGVICALKKGTLFDNISQVIIMVFISIPGFVLISYLISLSYSIDWLPSSWPKAIDPDSYKAAGYIIPIIVLSMGSIFGYARFVRAELCEVLQSEYLLLARTKGLTKRQAIMRHAFRNSMVPVLPSVVAEFISILGGSMILENLYNIPGVGQLYMAAFNCKDYSLLMVDMAFYTIIGLLSAIVVDLSYGFIDPRIRMGAKK